MVLKFKTNVVAFVLVVSFLATALLPTGQAFAATSQIEVPHQVQESATYTHETPTPQGVKRKAIEIVIKKLRENIDEVVDLLVDYKIMDGRTAQPLKKHAKAIAEQLEKWLDIPDEIIDTVKNQLPGILEKLGVSKGVAQTIAIGVSWLLRIADVIWG